MFNTVSYPPSTILPSGWFDGAVLPTGTVVELQLDHRYRKC